MKSKSQRPAEEDVWGGPAVLLAPGQARPTRARIFSQRSRENTNLIDHARPAGRPVGSACGFLSRSDAGQIALEPTANASRLLETSLNHRHFVDAHTYRMPLRSRGEFRGRAPTHLDHRAGCASVSRLQASRRPKTSCAGRVTHCSQLILIALATARLRALVKQLREQAWPSQQCCYSWWAHMLWYPPP